MFQWLNEHGAALTVLISVLFGLIAGGWAVYTWTVQSISERERQRERLPYMTVSLGPVLADGWREANITLYSPGGIGFVMDCVTISRGGLLAPRLRGQNRTVRDEAARAVRQMVIGWRVDPGTTSRRDHTPHDPVSRTVIFCRLDKALAKPRFTIRAREMSATNRPFKMEATAA